MTPRPNAQNLRRHATSELGEEPPLQPRRTRSPAKRSAILRAATDVFLEDGYARASMDAITARAGVGKQTVYGHFHDKQRLFLAVVDDARARAGASAASLAAALAGPGPARDRLITFGEELLRIALSPEIAALRRLVIAEGPHHPELDPMWGQGAPEVAITLLADFFTARTDLGELAVDDPRLAAEQFVTLVAATGVDQSAHGIRALSDEAKRTIATDAATLVVRAFTPR